MQPRLIPIANRTINSLIRTQGIGFFFRIWKLADRDGLDFHVTWIPEDTHELIGVKPTEEFDPKYMKALFEFGYERTMNGETWTDFARLVNEQ